MLKEIERKLGLRSKFLRPFVVDVNPHIVSVLALSTAFLSGYLFYANFLVVGALLVLLSGFLDVLDGEIAKARGPTAMGDFIDHTFDRLSDVAILVGIAFSPAVPFYVGGLATISVLLVSYMGTQAHAILKRREYGGVVGRADRMIVIALFSFATFLFPRALEYGMWLMVLLSVFTFAQRFVFSYRKIKKK